MLPPEYVSSEELRELISRLCDGKITSDEQVRLDTAIGSSPESRKEYISLMEVHERLQSQPISCFSFDANSAVGLSSRIASQLGNKTLPYLGMASAALVVIAIGLAATYYTLWNRGDSDAVALKATIADNSSRLEGVTDYIAEVIDSSVESKYYIERSGHRDRTGIYPGETLRLTEGCLLVEFKSGVKLTTKAPSAITFVSDMKARVLLGGLKATVAKNAHGFAILTPVADVVDLGTVFGVNVDTIGNTSVAVFAGVVDVLATVHTESNFQTTHLVAGDAIKLDDRGTQTRLDMLLSDLFPNFKRTSTTSRGAVILDAYDNLDPLGREKNYSIVLGGMDEDAVAYADRISHEWNGLTDKGMPKYLVGGDYVKMFNDNQVNTDFQMTVKLARPVNLYVLIDEYAIVPDWLRRDFEATGDYVGLDGGPSRFSPGEEWSTWEPDVGAGASIDRRFQVWHRRVNQSTEVRLGPNLSLGSTESERGVNMYGVVATPLN